jgi:hypothetical protein
VTVKAYPDGETAGATLTFGSEGVSQEVFYDVVKTFLVSLPGMLEAGVGCIWLLVPPGVFVMTPTIAPGLSKGELKALLDPTLQKLNESRISASMSRIHGKGEE